MVSVAFIDVAPDPVGLGIVAVVVLFVIGVVVFLAAALVAFLWYRKRSMRHLEMRRTGEDSQFSQPYQLGMMAMLFALLTYPSC